GLEEIHRPIEVLELERLGALDTNVLPEPLLVTVKLGRWSQRPVGHHGEQRSLDVEPEVPPAQHFADHPVYAEAAPELLQHIEIPVAIGLDEPPERVLGDDRRNRSVVSPSSARPQL